jgi:uncharacterized membrane protein YtjA (UPF0391 family)
VAWRASRTVARALLNTTSDFQPQEVMMLYWALVFLVVALVAGVLGFGGVAGTASSIAQVLFGLFLIIFVVSLLLGLLRGRPPQV